MSNRDSGSRRRRPPLTRRRLAQLALALWFLSAGALGGYYYFLLGQTGDEAGHEPPADHSPVSLPPPTPPEVNVTTDPNTLFVFRSYYPECGEEQARSLGAGVDLAGMNRDELARRFPGWHVDSFRPAQVILSRVHHGPCPDDVLYRTLGIRDGRVVVYSGRPENRGALLRDTGIRVDRLLPADVAKLRQGMAVRGEAGVWRVLEGLNLE